MVDEPNRSKDLEAEINRLEGVVRSIFLVGPGGEPVEAQIFYRRGTSVPRIRRGVEALLMSLGKRLGAEEIAVFELEPEPETPTLVIPGAVAGAGAVETAKPPRAVPVVSVTTTLLAIAGLMLLLTAPWVALVRLITEPLRTAPAGQAVRLTSPSAINEGPIRVAIATTPEPGAPGASSTGSTTSPRPTAVAGVRITAPVSATQAVPQTQVGVVQPAPPAATTPTPPAVNTPPAPGGGGATTPPAVNKPNGHANDDDDDDADDDRVRRHHRRDKHHVKAIFKEKTRGDGHHRKKDMARRNDDEDDRDQRDDDCDD